MCFFFLQFRSDLLLLFYYCYEKEKKKDLNTLKTGQITQTLQKTLTNFGNLLKFNLLTR